MGGVRETYLCHAVVTMSHMSRQLRRSLLNPSLTMIAQASIIPCLARQECSVRLVRWADADCLRRNSFAIASAHIPYSARTCTDPSIICHPSPSRRPSTQSLSRHSPATYTATSSTLNHDDIVSAGFMERRAVTWPWALGSLVSFSCASYVCTFTSSYHRIKTQFHLIYTPCLLQRGDSALRS
jgi:hypothetical protein